MKRFPLTRTSHLSSLLQWYVSLDVNDGTSHRLADKSAEMLMRGLQPSICCQAVLRFPFTFFSRHASPHLEFLNWICDKKTWVQRLCLLAVFFQLRTRSSLCSQRDYDVSTDNFELIQTLLRKYQHSLFIVSFYFTCLIMKHKDTQTQKNYIHVASFRSFTT